MMHILLTGPTATDAYQSALDIELAGAPPGQAQTPIAPLAVELMARGHEVTVVTLDTSIEEPVRGREGGLDIRYLPFRPRARHRARDLFEREISFLKQEFEDISPDLIHAHWTYEYAEAGRRTGMPLLVTAHDSPYAVLWHYRNLYRVARFAMAARTIFRLKELSVVSPYLAPHMRAMGFLGNISIIPNGLDLTVLPDGKKNKQSDGKMIISTIGDTGRRKNVSSVMKAFAHIKSALPQAELHLFGHGLDTEYAGGRSGVTGHALVSNSELIQFHRTRTDLLIHPSREEVCPVAIIEAMALGIPAIGGIRSGGVPYVFDNALADWLVDINQPEQIAQKAIKILQDRVLYEQVSETARSNVKSRFDIKQVANLYMDLYGKILGSGSR